MEIPQIEKIRTMTSSTIRRARIKSTRRSRTPKIIKVRAKKLREKIN